MKILENLNLSAINLKTGVSIRYLEKAQTDDVEIPSKITTFALAVRAYHEHFKEYREAESTNFRAIVKSILVFWRLYHA